MSNRYQLPRFIHHLHYWICHTFPFLSRDHRRPFCASLDRLSFLHFLCLVIHLHPFASQTDWVFWRTRARTPVLQAVFSAFWRLNWRWRQMRRMRFLQWEWLGSREPCRSARLCMAGNRLHPGHQRVDQSTRLKPCNPWTLGMSNLILSRGLESHHCKWHQLQSSSH